MSLTTSVIICAYTQNRWSQLLSAAESVRKQTTPVAEVLVVIDHNEELLSQAQAAMSWARVIANTGASSRYGVTCETGWRCTSQYSKPCPTSDAMRPE